MTAGQLIKRIEEIANLSKGGLNINICVYVPGNFFDSFSINLSGTPEDTDESYEEIAINCN